MDALTLIYIVIGIIVLIALIGVVMNLGDIARYFRMRDM